MRSLTASEAQDRSASISVSSYDVALDLTRGDTHFTSRTSIQFQSRDRRDTWVDVQPQKLESAELNGRQLNLDDLDDGRLPLDDLGDDNVLVVDALMAYSHDGEGLHRTVDTEDKQAYIYAMTFLPAAPRVFACFDQPDLKAVYRVSVVAPHDWVVLGNGRATQTEPGHWELAETEPLATYFATLVAGPYHSVTSEHDGIRLGLHCRQSLAPHLDKDAEELFLVTAQCFDEYHRMFGIRYPFGDYHQVFCPEFNAGAMENPGCVTFDDTFVFKAQATDALRSLRTTVIAHEMAHQWFGDLVTMTWWDDLWLNESFAEYMGCRVTHDATRFHESWWAFAYDHKPWGMAADQRASTHPVAGNGAQDTATALSNFDGISYTKGAAALRQLRAYLGDEAFIGGVVAHLSAHSFGNARLADLLGAWDAASDKDVHAWASAWLLTSGLDTLTCRAASDGTTVVERVNGSPVDVERPHAFDVTWFGASGETETVRVTVTGSATPVPFESYDGTGIIVPDSGDETWAKILLDEHSLAHAPEILGWIGDPLARAVVWGALRESVFDGVLDPSRYLETLEHALDAEPDLAVESLLAEAGALIGSYVIGPADRDRLATTAHRIVESSAPGSNRQLVAARAFIGTTSDVDTLSRWLEGHGPAGAKVDEDFRWRLLRSLCELGQRDGHSIAAERDRDPSSQGALHALECEAALPDEQSKATVWESITTQDSLSNSELYALGSYFFRPGQDSLIEPYVGRYFVDVPATASIRTGWMVERLAMLAYPRFSATSATVEAARACLSQEGLASGVRRVMADRTDDLQRAVASRQRFNR